MSFTFTKLFSGLTESTVWVEPYPTRILWVSMLSWADKRGRVFGSIPGIARRAGINMDEAEAAMVSFMSPDRHSRTPDNEGRRIEKIDGGWRLLNYAKYRELRDHEDRLDYQREWDRTHRPERYKNPTLPTNPTDIRPAPTKAEAEAEADRKSKALSGKPDASAIEVLNFLNEKANRRYRSTPVNLGFIKARLAEGYTAAECRQVIAKKCREWMADDKMAEYLRPATLFNREKFNQYAGELVIRETNP
jgi:uncharacterized phage protein (TIGR02220 family)